MVPFALIAFTLAYFTLKYQLLYIYDTQHESGGLWFPKVFNLTVFSLGLFQFFTFGSLVVNSYNNKGPALLVLILLGLTFAFWIYCGSVLKPLSDRVTGDSELAVQLCESASYYPAFNKELFQIWLPEEQTQSFYTPEYADIEDFKAKNPNVVWTEEKTRRPKMFSIFKPKQEASLDTIDQN
jgi:hypothetical protein